MSDGVVDAKLVEEMTIEGEEEAPEVEVAEGEPAEGGEGAAKKKKKKKKKKKNTEANQQNGTYRQQYKCNDSFVVVILSYLCYHRTFYTIWSSFYRDHKN